MKKMKEAGIKPRHRKNKEAHVPNLYPFKKNLLEQYRLRQNTKGNPKDLDASKFEENVEMLQNAMKLDNDDRMMEEEEVVNEKGDKTNYRIKNSTKSLEYVMENADILLEILDARDPEGCRCRQLERQFIARNPQNKIILVLNKIDLVPLHIVQKWKSILSREYPTILFKSNMQEQNRNLSSVKLFNKSITERKELTNELLNSSKAVGADRLLELIKNYSKHDGVKMAITLGVIGYPNVGKSSLINSMTKRKAAGVSNQPGFTKGIQEIDIDSKTTIIDCPGVVMSNEDETVLLLRNTIKPENVKDLDKAIEEILKRVDKEELLKLYRIADFMNYKEFLINLAHAKGKLKKGGLVDLELVSRMVIQDWNNGKLSYYVAPPTDGNEFQQTIVFNN